MENSGNLQHLAPATIKILDAPLDERIAFTKTDRWINYERADLLAQKLDDLRLDAGRMRPGCGLIIGPANSGKSSLAAYYEKKHPPFQLESGQSRRTVLYIPAMVPASTTRLHCCIIEAAGFAYNPNSKAAFLERQAERILEDLGVQLLILDEMNTISAAANLEQKKVLARLRYFNVRFKIAIAGFTAPNGANVTVHDPSFSSRFERWELPKWENGHSWRQFLSRVEGFLPFRESSKLSSSAFSDFLFRESEAILGEQRKLVEKLAVHALRNNHPKITPDLLKDVDWIRPSLRPTKTILIETKDEKDQKRRKQ